MRKNNTKKTTKTIRNKRAEIRSREDKRGNLRTETFRRDTGSVSIAVSTNPRNDSTRLFVDTPEGESYTFDGRTARTLYRALQKHYRYTDKTN